MSALHCCVCQTQVHVVCWSSRISFHKTPFSKSVTLPKIIRRTTTACGHLLYKEPRESAMVSNSPRCNHQMVTFGAYACNAYQGLSLLLHHPLSREPGYEARCTHTYTSTTIHATTKQIVLFCSAQNDESTDVNIMNRKRVLIKHNAKIAIILFDKITTTFDAQLH